MTEPLFPEYPDPQVPEQTRGEKLRARQQVWIDDGMHPLTKLPLANNGHTCGDCIHRVRVSSPAGNRFPKCDLTSMSRCEQSDCRAWWPACISWEPKQPP